MADIYFKPSYGAGGNGSQAQPYDAFSDHTQSANDNLYLACGETFNTTLTLTQSGITVTSYGAGAKPIINASSATTGAIYGSGRSNITISNLDLRGANTYPGAGVHLLNGAGLTIHDCDISGNNYGIRIDNNSANAYSGVTIYNNTISDTTGDAAIIVVWGSASGGVFNNISIHDNELLSGCGYQGLFVICRPDPAPVADAYRAQNVEIYNNNFYGLTGWPLQARGWYGANKVYNNGIYNCGDGTADMHGFNFQIIDDCDVRDNYIDGITAYNPGPDGSGVGIFMDVSCRRFKVRWNTIKNTGINGGSGSYQHGGSGIFIYNSASHEVYGNLIIDCRNGISLQDDASTTYYNTDGCTISNNLIDGATKTGIYVCGAGDSNRVVNNIVINTPYGIYVENGAAAPTNFTESHNLVFGYTTAFTTGTHSASTTPTTSRSTPSNCLTVDPLLDSNYRPTDSSPCIGAGTYIAGVKDYHGKRIKNPPDIGAIQNFGSRTISSRRGI